MGTERVAIDADFMADIMRRMPGNAPTDVEMYVATWFTNIPDEGRKAYVQASRVKFFARDDDLVAIGASIGNEIHFAAGFYDTETAAGRALIVHEWVHQTQRNNIPDFERAYDQEERRRLANGEDVMGNLFELEAYIVEAKAYCDYLDEGYPPGDWVPLYYDRYGCP